MRAIPVLALVRPFVAGCCTRAWSSESLSCCRLTSVVGVGAFAGAAGAVAGSGLACAGGLDRDRRERERLRRPRLLRLRARRFFRDDRLEDDDE